VDVVTWVTACAAAIQAGLFVQLGAPDVCEASASSTPETALVARPPAIDEWAPLVRAAAQRFGVPEAWVRAVIQLESAGAPDARSHVGAIGLMQMMPGTYAELTARYQLGDDPAVPAASVAAGTAYLREMLDRFGAPNAFAAYNAGPGRVLDHLLRGRSLPDETRRYVAQLRRALPDLTGTGDTPLSTTDQGVTATVGSTQEIIVDTALQSGRTPASSMLQRGRIPTSRGGALFVQLPRTHSAALLHADGTADANLETPDVRRGSALFVPLERARAPRER
jgi:hypothetical protein